MYTFVLARATKGVAEYFTRFKSFDEECNKLPSYMALWCTDFGHEVGDSISECYAEDGSTVTITCVDTDEEVLQINPDKL